MRTSGSEVEWNAVVQSSRLWLHCPSLVLSQQVPAPRDSPTAGGLSAVGSPPPACPYYYATKKEHCRDSRTCSVFTLPPLCFDALI